jgi:LmbE family N-acetylglucosaminyl deacetylase
MIVAHPDDESLFGGEALTSSSGWTVACVTNGSNAVRRAEFIAAMTTANANWIMLDHADDLTNGNFDPHLRAQLASILSEHPYELVVTHNARGEYGHAQHRALHAIVTDLVPPGVPLAVFDHHWRLFPKVSDAKRALIAHYATQTASIRYTWMYASRERLRRIR